MQRGQTVTEIATGRRATIVSVRPNGTAGQPQPWAKVMFPLGTGGVSFACRLLSELAPGHEPTCDPRTECVGHEPASEPKTSGAIEVTDQDEIRPPCIDCQNKMGRGVPLHPTCEVRYQAQKARDAANAGLCTANQRGLPQGWNVGDPERARFLAAFRGPRGPMR